MNTTGLLANLESSVTNQVMLAGNDSSVESAAQAILAVLEPALLQAALDLAQQAAAEVEAQLGDQRVEVVVSDGEPSLRVEALDSEPSDRLAVPTPVTPDKPAATPPPSTPSAATPAIRRRALCRRSGRQARRSGRALSAARPVLP